MTERKDSVKILRQTCHWDTERGCYVGRVSAAELRAFEREDAPAWRVELLPLGQEALQIVAEADTLQQAEAGAVAKMQGAMRMMALLNVFAGASMTAAEAVVFFLARWARLPPLVRAGWACGEVEQLRNLMRRRIDNKAFHKRFTRLDRRERVNALFAQADSAWIDLLISLTADADGEAERAGIDLDTKYAPLDGWEHHEDMKAALSTRELASSFMEDGELEKQLVDSAGEEMGREIDAEVMREWDEVAGKKPSFASELRDLINRHSKENGSGTPDDVLATFMLQSLGAYEATVRERDRRAKG